MDITITRTALRTMLFGILSCHCPVTSDVERDLFQTFHAESEGDTLDFGPYMAVADQNPVRTPLHLFLEYCRYGHDDPARFAIGLEDVIRYFCSRFHYNAAKAALDPVRIPDSASQLVGHMLLVAEPAQENGWTTSMDGHRFELQNIFLPPQISRENGGLFGVHFGMVLCRLTPQQARITRDHLALIPELTVLARRFDAIDYAEYQTFGDHRAQIAERYKRNF